MKHLKPARRHLIKTDKELARVVKNIKLEPRTRQRASPYVRLVSAIISQQISTSAARAIYARFKNLFDGEIDFAQLLKFSTEKLRSAGVSPQKIGYLRDLAEKVVSGKVPTADQLKKMSDQQIIEALLPIKGVGVWTIQMLLIFHFDRPDVWPVRDLGVKKGYMKVHRKKRLPEEKALEKFGHKFSPFRSYAALYYWRSLDDLAKAKKVAKTTKKSMARKA